MKNYWLTSIDSTHDLLRILLGPHSVHHFTWAKALDWKAYGKKNVIGRSEFNFVNVNSNLVKQK